MIVSGSVIIQSNYGMLKQVHVYQLLKGIRVVNAVAFNHDGTMIVSGSMIKQSNYGMLKQVHVYSPEHNWKKHIVNLLRRKIS